MQFHLTKKQITRKGQWLLPPIEGQTICYTEPLYHHLLPKLMQALQETKWPFQFHGYYYRLTTKKGLIEEELPASEYYKLAWRSMSQKYHGATLALQSIESIAADLAQSYPVRRQVISRTNQPKISFSLELYTLRTSFASLLFLIRSLLDEFASLAQFLTAPNARQFGSFAGIVAKCEKSDANSLVEIPEELRSHLAESSAWFWRMRDLRDYISHHGFVSFNLIESSSGELRFYIHDRLDMLAIAREFMQGLNSLLSQIDIAYAKRVQSA